MQGIKRLVALAAATTAILAIPAGALAREPSQSAYSHSDASVVDPNSHSSGGPGATAANSTSEHSGTGLPFTGLDVVLLAAVGTGLLALGLSMRQMTRRPESA